MRLWFFFFFSCFAHRCCVHWENTCENIFGDVCLFFVLLFFGHSFGVCNQGLFAGLLFYSLLRPVMNYWKQSGLGLFSVLLMIFPLPKNPFSLCKRTFLNRVFFFCKFFFFFHFYFASQWLWFRDVVSLAMGFEFGWATRTHSKLKMK